ncbi:MAG: NlpC/P60 family protein [Ancrocorticia sp.]
MTLPLGIAIPATADPDATATILPAEEVATPADNAPTTHPSEAPSESAAPSATPSPSAEPGQVEADPTETPAPSSQPSPSQLPTDAPSSHAVNPAKSHTPQPTDTPSSSQEIFGDNTHAVWGNELGIDPEIAPRTESGVAPASNSPSAVKNHKFFLNDRWSGVANIEFAWGTANYQVLVGDWDGDGKDTIALRKGNQFAFSKKSPASGTPNFTMTWGLPTDTVLVGDWNGDGKDTLAIRRGNSYHIKNSLSGPNTDILFYFGNARDEVFVGDWDGNGTDTLAIRRGNRIHISNKNASGRTDKVISYGRPGDDLYVGSFDRSRPGRDSFAVRRGNTYFINKTIKSGNADIRLDYGRAKDVALLGDWNGDGEDTLGVVRSVATKDVTQKEPPPVSKNKGAQVLAFAKKYEGAPYVWSGITPAGWDCIGMVRYVYKQFGVEIGGYPVSVLNAGRQIPFSQAKPGDILYWSKENSNANNAHVALYVDSATNFGAWNEDMGTRDGKNSWVGGTPIVIRIFD